MSLLASQITFKHKRQVLETATIAYILDDSLYGMTARKGCPNVPNLWVCVSSIPLLYPCLRPTAEAVCCAVQVTLRSRNLINGAVRDKGGS